MNIELEKATGYAKESFEALENERIQEAYNLAPGIFEFFHDGPAGVEYQISNEVSPYLQKVVEWNEKYDRFEGIFWGTLTSGDFEYRGWVTVDASDSTGYIPLEFEIIAIDSPEGELAYHPLLGKTVTREENDMLNDIEYEIQR